jgi:hypothetical protein
MGMERYNFLFKPVFFIVSLLFSSWLVIQVERLQPSDLGRFEKLFDSGEKEEKPSPEYIRAYLHTLYRDHQEGRISDQVLTIEVYKFLEKLK